MRNAEESQASHENASKGRTLLLGKHCIAFHGNIRITFPGKRCTILWGGDLGLRMISGTPPLYLSPFTPPLLPPYPPLLVTPPHPLPIQPQSHIILLEYRLLGRSPRIPPLPSPPCSPYPRRLAQNPVCREILLENHRASCTLILSTTAT